MVITVIIPLTNHSTDDIVFTLINQFYCNVKATPASLHYIAQV